jgi:hypothetical protein
MLPLRAQMLSSQSILYRAASSLAGTPENVPGLRAFRRTEK